MMEENEWFSKFFDCSIFKVEVWVDLISGAVESDWKSYTAVSVTVDILGEFSVSLIEYGIINLYP